MPLSGMPSTSRKMATQADLTDDEMAKLIDLYQGHENLYNYNLRSYHDRDKARQSYRYIAVEMGKNWDEDTTKRKLKSIRSSYTRAYKMLIPSRKSGASAGDIKMPKWKWYHALDAFLRPYCKLRPGDSNLPSTAPTGSTQDIYLDDSQNLLYEEMGEDQPNVVLENENNTPDIELLCSQVHQNRPSTSSVSPVSFSGAPADLVTRAQCKQTVQNTPSPPLSMCTNDGNTENEAPNFHTGKVTKKRKQDDVSLMVADLLKNHVAVSMAEKRAKLERKKEKTDNEMFCTYVANQLDGMPKDKQRVGRMKIQQILYDLTCENSE